MSSWFFFTNHALVVLAIARDPSATLRQIALAVGVTERAVGEILRDLEQAGYVRSRRIGRRKHYTLDGERQLRHPLTAEHSIGEVLEVLAAASPGRHTNGSGPAAADLLAGEADSRLPTVSGGAFAVSFGVLGTNLVPPDIAGAARNALYWLYQLLP